MTTSKEPTSSRSKPSRKPRFSIAWSPRHRRWVKRLIAAPPSKSTSELASLFSSLTIDPAHLPPPAPPANDGIDALASGFLAYFASEQVNTTPVTTTPTTTTTPAATSTVSANLDSLAADLSSLTIHP
ncbi:unnamed protein product [Peniophora sp. CBMAI 1063]|nr:unnamed protein product [Peniophora sp. CBMAI 1063]